MKVLFLGFSVLTHHLYCDLIKRSTLSKQIDVFAIGGHHYNYLFPILDHVLKVKKANVVVLDLVSTPCRRWITIDGLRMHLTAILDSLSQRGLRAGFANLYRHDFDPATDMMCKEIHNVATVYNLPVIDLATWSAQLSKEEREKIYFDGVHVSPEGSKRIANLLVKFTDIFVDPEKGKIVENMGFPNDIVTSLGSVVALNCLIGKESFSTRLHSRYGVEIVVPQIRCEQKAIFHPPKNCIFNGVYMIAGPQSGEVKIHQAKGSELFMVYDQFCYYDRIRHFPLKLSKPDVPVTVKVLPEMPNVKLTRGKSDLSERIAEVALFTLRRT